MNLVFAYGSNMDGKQMEERCPGAKFYGIGFLPDYKLGFTRYSEKRETSVADILISPGDEVWGIIYEISDEDLKRLDSFEGVPTAYRRITEKVQKYNSGPGDIKSLNEEDILEWLQRDREQHRKDPNNYTGEQVFVYEVVNKNMALKDPSYKYINLILNGAYENHFPPSYIKKIGEFFDRALYSEIKSPAMNFFLNLIDLIESKDFPEIVRGTKEWAGAKLVITGQADRRDQLKGQLPDDIVVFTKYWQELSWITKKIFYDTSINRQIDIRVKEDYLKELGEAAIEYQNENNEDTSHVGICEALTIKAYELFTGNTPSMRIDILK